MSIDFQGLLNLVTANEKAERFNLGCWAEVDSCGTFGCLVGNFCLHHPEDELVLKGHFQGSYYPPSFRDQPDECPYAATARRFGITPYESEWMFGCQEMIQMESIEGWMYETRKTGFGRFDLFDGEGRDTDDKAAAIARVRKFIYYKLHKQEMLYEADGRVKESARRAEGDHHVIRKVLEKV
jgi:hypothetical protein